MDEPPTTSASVSARPRVLMLAHRVPYPPDRGDRIRSYHLLRELSQHCDVSLACVSEEPISEAQRRQLTTLTEQRAIVRLPRFTSRMRGGAALCTGRAITPAIFYIPHLARVIRQWHEAQPFDAVLCFCTGMAQYVTMPAPPPRRVLDLVDVDSLKWEQYAASARWPRRWLYGAEARRLRRIESGQVVDWDALSVISEAERSAAEQSGIGVTCVAGNGVDLADWPMLPDSDEPVIVFVGVLDYAPNVRGIAWFVERVMPLLRQRVPAARLRIVGRSPTRAVRRLGRAAGVEVVGPVTDVRPELARAAAAIAPLRVARGVQNKVLQAMASGRAVVCSPAAAEGIDAAPNEHLLIADEPADYVAHLERLLSDRADRRALAARARQRIEEHYDWSRTLAPLLEAVV